MYCVRVLRTSQAIFANKLKIFFSGKPAAADPAPSAVPGPHHTRVLLAGGRA
jgi:hypothetical protein